MSMLSRIKYRLKRFSSVDDDLSRRVEVERSLLEAASGKIPLPDASECKRLALMLGVPSWFKKK